jgi:hypothetical protein
MSDEFDTFWRAYPRRISKGTARTAFAKAIRKTTLEAMLAAIEDYKRFKPERIDFKHPATWLNGECWSDEWQTVPRETNRRRSFSDVAIDRFNNGSTGVQGSGSDVGGVPPDDRQSRFDGERLRIGDSRPFIASRH